MHVTYNTSMKPSQPDLLEQVKCIASRCFARFRTGSGENITSNQSSSPKKKKAEHKLTFMPGLHYKECRARTCTLT